MTAPHPKPLAGHPTDTLHGIALGIQLGHLPRAEHPLWEAADYQSAADELLNEDNPFELDFLIAREECWQRYRREQLPEGYDFGSFLADRAFWNGPNSIYARAQTNAERRG